MPTKDTPQQGQKSRSSMLLFAMIDPICLFRAYLMLVIGQCENKFDSENGDCHIKPRIQFTSEFSVLDLCEIFAIDNLPIKDWKPRNGVAFDMF